MWLPCGHVCFSELKHLSLAIPPLLDHLLEPSHISHPCVSHPPVLIPPAAALALPEWSALEDTLWNLAQQSTVHPLKAPSNSLLTSTSTITKVCMNESLAASCPHQYCRYTSIFVTDAEFLASQINVTRPFTVFQKERKMYSSPASVNSHNICSLNNAFAPGVAS